MTITPPKLRQYFYEMEDKKWNRKKRHSNVVFGQKKIYVTVFFVCPIVCRILVRIAIILHYYDKCIFKSTHLHKTNCIRQSNIFIKIIIMLLSITLIHLLLGRSCIFLLFDFHSMRNGRHY